MTNNNGFIHAGRSLVVSVDGKPYSVNAGNESLFNEVLRLVKDGNYAAVPDTIDRMSNIVRKIAASVEHKDKIVVQDRRVYAVNEDGSKSRLFGYEITKLLELLDSGFNIQPIMNFALKVRKNPNESVRSRLYEFMEYGNLPLTEDGNFLAYKVVRENYKDKHSNMFNNHVGQTPTMDRAEVDDNDNVTCSTGLHVCSKEYVKSFYYGSDHLMVVKVSPEDVVSIPTDYNNTKMRLCKYEVIAELTSQDDPAFFGKAVYVPTSTSTVTDKLGRPMPKRDAKGHFVKASA